MLSVKNLHASVEGKEILRGIDLEVREGEVHAIMGPNGSGKSTLASVLAGNPKYTVTAGSVEFLGRDLLSLPVEERACMGLFLGFQYPVEIPGVTMANFMKMAVQEQRKYRGEEPLTAAEFLRLMKEKSAVVGGVTPKQEECSFMASTVLIFSAPLPRCMATPASESLGMLSSISTLLLEVGPMPARLTAV